MVIYIFPFMKFISLSFPFFLFTLCWHFSFSKLRLQTFSISLSFFSYQQFLVSLEYFSSIVNLLLTYLYKTRILQAHHRLARDNSKHHRLLLLLLSFIHILLLPLFSRLSFVPLLRHLHERFDVDVMRCRLRLVLCVHDQCWTNTKNIKNGDV